MENRRTQSPARPMGSRRPGARLTWKEVVLLGAAAQLIAASDANAYLDAGTGSIIFQAIVAFLVGAAFTVKVYWHRIKNFFRRGRPESERVPPRRPRTDDGRS